MPSYGWTIVPPGLSGLIYIHRRTRRASWKATARRTFIIRPASSGAAMRMTTIPISHAKVHLQTFLRRQYPELAVHIVGSEAMEQQGDAEIVKFAHGFFHRADRMTPQR
jgi:hypothetical protein